MAVPGFAPIALGNCVDNDKIADTFASLQALNTFSQQGAPDLDCQSFAESLAGDQQTGQECVTLFPGATVNPTLNQGLECCFFLLNFTGSHRLAGSADGQVEVDFRYTLKCDGLSVATGLVPSGSVSGFLIQADCPPGAKVAICFDVEATQTHLGSASAGNASQGDVITDINDDFNFVPNEEGSSGGGSYRVVWNMKVCGGRACITQRDITAQNVYIPCEVKPECCYGLATLALMVQVLNALCRSFTFGGKRIRCENIDTDGLTSVPAALNLPADTDWIALGAMTVCVERMQPGDTITVEPVIGCASDPVQCLVARIQRKSNETYSWYENFCTEVPVLACGQCAKGESLFVGEAPIIECDTQPSDPNITGPMVDVQGNYSVWIFEDIVNESHDLQPIGQVGVCNNRQLLTDIEDKGEAIHEAACEIQPINKTFREVKDIFPVGTPGMIQPAQPWPPPTPPPRPVPDPPPIKKWRVYGWMRVCSTLSEADFSAFNDTEDTAIVEAHYEILCGGVPIHTSPPCPWQITGSGQYDPCGPRINIAPPMVQCPIDQDLEIVAVVTTLLTGAAPVITDYEVEFCVPVLCF